MEFSKCISTLSIVRINNDLYVEYLAKLSAIIKDYESSKVAIIGILMCCWLYF